MKVIGLFLAASALCGCIAGALLPAAPPAHARAAIAPRAHHHATVVIRTAARAIDS